MNLKSLKYLEQILKEINDNNITATVGSCSEVYLEEFFSTICTK